MRFVVQSPISGDYSCGLSRGPSPSPGIGRTRSAGRRSVGPDFCLDSRVPDSGTGLCATSPDGTSVRATDRDCAAYLCATTGCRTTWPQSREVCPAVN